MTVAMASSYASTGDWHYSSMDPFNKETDDEMIQAANQSVDEAFSLIENNSSIDNEFVNYLSINSKSASGNEAITDVFQSAAREPITVQLLVANDQNGIVNETQHGEQTPTSSTDLPKCIEMLLENNGSSTSVSKVPASGCRGSGKKARRKSFPERSEVSQLQTELPTFIAGLLENTACSSVKRKVECDGNDESKKKGRKSVKESIATKQSPGKEKIQKQEEKKEKERLRQQKIRADKKQLDADNEAKRLLLEKEVDDLRNLITEKEEEMKNLQLEITNKEAEIINLNMKAKTLQQEKDLEIVYLQKKVKRLEHEQEEKDAKIDLLKYKLECKT